MRYTIKHIGIWSAFKFGTLIGGIIGFLHGLAAGLTLRWAVARLYTWLDSWLTVSVPFSDDLRLVDALKLGDVLDLLERLDDGSMLMVVGVVFAFAAFGGLIVGLLTVLAAFVYNVVAAFSGGFEVQADVTGGVPPMALQPVAASIPLSATPAPQPSAAPPQPIRPPVSVPVPPPQALAWLVSSKSGERYPIHSDGVRIGSAPDNQIALAGLAPHHARVQVEGGRYILHDLSGGQSWVNGRLLSAPNMLKDGFRVRLGNQEFVFQGG